jgi:proteasome lid subunit RPN8/RPN11
MLRSIKCHTIKRAEMNEAGIESAPVGPRIAPLIPWNAPECPFLIEYSPRVLDDIRLAVVDAFFSLPRGGAEIGGILLGRWEDGSLSITEYAALDCEHATGPSFNLSARDEIRLSELLAGVPSAFPGLLAVGWYHSHTRSEIFLSETDLEIHNRYFPETWQVALVMKPHTFQPTRAGIFFREDDGSIRADAPYREIVIDALPMRPATAGPDIEMPQPVGRPTTIKLERNPVFGIPVAPQQPVAEPVTHTPELPADLPAPQFLTMPAPSRRLVAALWIMGLLALGAGAWRTHDVWLGRVIAAVRPARAPEPPASAGLTTFDRDGQLQINWDRNSPAVRQAVEATLEISDGGPLPQAITLDRAHLQNGFFTYARQSERVDVKLILHQPEGQQFRDVTTFLGKLPPPKVSEPDRDQIAAEAARLKNDLESQAARTKKLEQDLKSMRNELRVQQQRRLANQLPEGKQ